MSAEVLERVAAQIRADWPDHAEPDRDTRTMRTVADWLAAQADRWESECDRYWWISLNAWNDHNDEPMPAATETHFRTVAAEFADGSCRDAINVARAYLGEES